VTRGQAHPSFARIDARGFATRWEKPIGSCVIGSKAAYVGRLPVIELDMLEMKKHL
jgi:hypothetical protein